jgi:hypothetical protein
LNTRFGMEDGAMLVFVMLLLKCQDLGDNKSGARIIVTKDLSVATCSLRWYFPSEERTMQYSRDKYFPQLRTKVINPVGEPSKIPLSAPAHTRANTCTQRK